MTYGEELGSEMQQDSIVLTYLEGLLMHQAAGPSGTDNGSSVRSTADQNFKLSGNVFSSCQSNGSVLSNPAYQGSGLLHLKKARLLQSSEDWNAAKRRRLSDPIVELNGKKETLLAGMVENVPKGKQDSTLLASLLQSFSSRLQTVALSQQIRQSLKDQGYSHNQESLQKEKDPKCYGAASSHLKTLLKKNKAKDPKRENPPDTTQHRNDGFIDSPKTGQSTNKGVAEPLSCAARLQAVASMVENRSSPTNSPKPSVACSQLALLLSSEAHLQQYSQEHTLKAQNASQLASERLAAMARLQESAQQDFSQFQLSNRATNINCQSRTPPKTTTNTDNLKPFQSPVGIPSSPAKMANYKNHSDRNNSKPSLNNSLLLHLLKSQNVLQQSKIHKRNESCTVYENSSTPTTIDEYSDNNPSFTEDDSSDDESSHSNCVPIDLSFKQKQDKSELLQSPSLDNLTQSLLQNWNPKVQGLDISKENNDSSSPTLKSHQKVTLLQLLLGHRSDEHPEKNIDLHRPQHSANLSQLSVQTGMPIPTTENSPINRMTPLNTPPLFNCAKADSPINLSHPSPAMNSDSPPYICNGQRERLINPASKHLIDLSKSKEPQPPKPLTSENPQSNATFSASKLLQNLAQCGMQTSSSVDELKICKKLLNGNTDKPVSLIDRLGSPLLPNRATVFEENNKRFSSPRPTEPGLSGSEIENLLERRTVLQLLLGTPSKSKNDKKSKKLLKHEDLQGQSDKGLNGQILTVKIKTEPSEEDLNTRHNPHVQGMNVSKNNKCLGISHSIKKTTDNSPAPGNFKHEPISPQDFSFSRNGLLSRLLRQNHDDYPTNDLDVNQKNGEFTISVSKNLSTIPKKRKLPETEPSGSHTKRMKDNVSEGANRHISPTDAIYGPLLHQQERNCNRLDTEFNYTASHGSLNETESRSFPRESKGFNVLKQLLLSENCIQDVTQHSNNITPDGRMNGSNTSMANKSDYVSSLHALMGNHTAQTNCVDHRTFHYHSVVNSPSRSLPEHFGSTVPKPELGQYSACPTTVEKGPIRWVITGMEKGEFGRDSPRLTKTNPILYYMLQKGGHSVSNQEMQGRNGWCDPSLMDNATHLAFRGDADRERKAHFLNLQNSYSHMKNATSHHSGSRDVFGLSEKVQMIKKEPE